MKKAKISTYISIALSVILVILILLKLTDLRHGKKLNTQKAELIKQTLLDGSQLILGNPEAPNTLIVYFSYECKYSRAFFHNNLPSISEHLVETQRINIVLKPVVLVPNEELAKAYNMLYCLNTIGIFDELHTLLLNNYDIIYSYDFATFRNDIIMDNNEIAECFSNQEHSPTCIENKRQLNAVYKNAVPVFIINNRLFIGKISWQEIENILPKN